MEFLESKKMRILVFFATDVLLIIVTFLTLLHDDSNINMYAAIKLLLFAYYLLDIALFFLGDSEREGDKVVMIIKNVCFLGILLIMAAVGLLFGLSFALDGPEPLDDNAFVVSFKFMIIFLPFVKFFLHDLCVKNTIDQKYNAFVPFGSYIASYVLGLLFPCLGLLYEPIYLYGPAIFFGVLLIATIIYIKMRKFTFSEEDDYYY